MLPRSQMMLTPRVELRKRTLLACWLKSTSRVPAKLYSKYLAHGMTTLDIDSVRLFHLYPLGTNIEIAPRMNVIEMEVPTQQRTVMLYTKAVMRKMRVQ